MERVLEALGGASAAEFRQHSEELIHERVAKDELKRELHWTEAITVGSERFVRQMARVMSGRQHLTIDGAGDTWTLRNRKFLTVHFRGEKRAAGAFVIDNEMRNYLRSNHLLRSDPELRIGRSGPELRIALKIPADFLPPFERGLIPPELSQRVADAKLEDAESVLAEFWRFYDDLVQSKHRAMGQRMLSGQPVMISEESVPPEYRQSVPWGLEVRLSGLRDAQAIVNEMWAFRREEEVRREQEEQRERMMGREQALSALRRAGMSPPSLDGRRMASVPTAFPSTPSSRDPRDEVPAMYREWITPEAARRLSPSDLWLLRQNAKNLEISKQGGESLRQEREANRLRQLPSYQIVPSSLADRNLAVEKPAAPILPPALPVAAQPSLPMNNRVSHEPQP